MSYRTRLARPPAETSDEVIGDAYRAVFGTPQGQLVLDHIVQTLCGVDTNLFIASDHGLAYNAARRDVGLEIARIALGLTHRRSKPEVITHE